MAGGAGDILGVTADQFRSNDAELAFMRERQFVEVVRKAATGSADMDATFALDRNFRLVYVRCHFAVGSGTVTTTELQCST